MRAVHGTYAYIIYALGPRAPTTPPLPPWYPHRYPPLALLVRGLGGVAPPAARIGGAALSPTSPRIVPHPCPARNAAICAVVQCLIMRVVW